MNVLALCDIGHRAYSAKYIEHIMICNHYETFFFKHSVNGNESDPIYIKYKGLSWVYFSAKG